MRRALLIVLALLIAFELGVRFDKWVRPTFNITAAWECTAPPQGI